MSTAQFDPEKLRSLRMERGWSVAELSRRTERNRVSICMWEAGETVPTFESMQAIAEAFGLDTIEELLTKREG